MSDYTQENRFLTITSPLGKDALLLASVSGNERISSIYEYELEALSESDTIDAKKIVGKSVTVEMHGKEVRHIDGYVICMSRGDMLETGKDKTLRQYRMTIVPWLWFLSRRVNCRIFQEMTAVDVIEEVFKDHKVIAKYQKKLKSTYKKREYCVQFNESDLDFITRLLEEEGIAYYFAHDKGKHELVLVDQKNAYADCAEAKVVYSQGDRKDPHLFEWDHEYSFTTGKWSVTDYDFKKPTTSLMASAPTVVDLPGINQYEHYEYPGFYETASDGKNTVEARMTADEVPHDNVKGASNCLSFYAGGMFQLSEHESKSETGKYLLTSVTIRAKDDSYLSGEGSSQGYSNTVQCIPATVHFRPPVTRIKPIMRGPQTAVVVGNKGEEIHIDKYSRIKVQFYWDREGKLDANSTCYIRVAQAFAGNKWGSQFIPRIGQEVIINFLDGDPDRPIVTGSVYNADNMPPYPTKTQSGIKTHSTTKGGTSNFNELRFEDKKGSEEIFIQAEKDFKRLVKNDEEGKIEANHTLKITKASKTEAKSILLKAQDSITLKVGGSTIKMTPTGIVIKSTKVDVKGSAMTVVKGGLVKVN
ncbi:MAG: type VI secretion system tip protein VgrG [Gammaproteobacteria bacterium]|jgi:type VI secretion system secreted protein VgrG